MACTAARNPLEVTQPCDRKGQRRRKSGRMGSLPDLLKSIGKEKTTTTASLLPQLIND